MAGEEGEGDVSERDKPNDGAGDALSWAGFALCDGAPRVRAVL